MRTTSFPTLKALAITLLALVGVSACAPPGRYITLKNGQPPTPLEIRQDSLKCEKEAALTYPFAQVIGSRPGMSSGLSTTNCYSSGGNSVACTTSAGISIPPSITTSDGNATNRVNFYRTCMESLGYQRTFFRNTDRSQGRYGNSAQQEIPYGQDKHIVEEGGYCNEPADCTVGLTCAGNTCSIPLRGSTARGASPIDAGGKCGQNASCKSGFVCVGARCVVNMGRTQ